MNVIDTIKIQLLPDGSVASNAFTNSFAQKTGKDEWKKQGLRMFARKYYEQAQSCLCKTKKCFWFA